MTTLAQTEPKSGFKFGLLGTAVHALLIALLTINTLRVPAAKKTFDEFGLTLPWITQTYIQFSLWIGDNIVPVTLAVFLLLFTDFVLTQFLGRCNRSAQLFWMIGIGLLLLVVGIFSVVAIELPIIKLKEGLSH